jgi:histidinol-phosphate aminotransferase
MSKSFSLAGLRVGYAMASEELISGLTRIRNCFNSYSVSALAQKAAAAAVEEYGVMQASVAEIKRTRAYVSAELRKVGYTVPDSNANFLFVTHPQRSMPAIFQALRAQKILVRYFAAPRIDDRIRVTVGTPEQMEAFLTAIKAM